MEGQEKAERAGRLSCLRKEPGLFGAGPPRKGPKLGTVRALAQKRHTPRACSRYEIVERYVGATWARPADNWPDS